MDSHNEVKSAYEWAMNQRYQSIAAQYARVLAHELTSLRAENERLRTAYEAPRAPLTTEELEQMDGELVYVQNGDGEEGWATVQIGQPDMYSGDPDFINMTYNDPAGHFGLHVLGWQAFGRKPDDARANNTRLVAQVESQRVEIDELRKSIPPLLLERDRWKCRAEAAEADLRVANKCITCAHNTGAEGEKWCKSPDKSVRLVNRKEDRYIRAECCAWEWRGPKGEEAPADGEERG